MTDLMKYAEEKNFSKFQEIVKDKLKETLANHPTIVDNMNQTDRFNDIKQVFKSISDDYK